MKQTIKLTESELRNTTELTLVENPTVDDRCESNLKSSGSLKQEMKCT